MKQVAVGPRMRGVQAMAPVLLTMSLIPTATNCPCLVLRSWCPSGSWTSPRGCPSRSRPGRSASRAPAVSTNPPRPPLCCRACPHDGGTRREAGHVGALLQQVGSRAERSAAEARSSTAGWRWSSQRSAWAARQRRPWAALRKPFGSAVQRCWTPGAAISSRTGA